MKRLSFAFLAVVGGSAGWAMAATNSGGVPEATQALLDSYPGLGVVIHRDRVMAFHGARMNSAETPEQAAEWWLAQNSAAFNVPDLDLRLERTNSVNPAERWTVFAYKQYIENVPVEFGLGRLLVANGSPNYVILAAAKLATPPVEGFAADNLTSEDAFDVAQDAYGQLTEWGTPEMVIYYGQGDGPSLVTPVRAWKVAGKNTLQGDAFESYSIFVNASDGEIVFARSEKYHTDITGTAHGMATPYLPKDATYPDDAQNPPSDQILEDVQALVVGGTPVNANDDGSFVIPHDGDVEVTVQGKLIGPWVNVIDDTGPELVLNILTTPPGPVDLFWNQVVMELDTAEVNAMIHATNTHDFYVERQPGFTGLAQIQAHVNQNSTCNAFFSGNTINFYKEGGGCPNTCYSSVIAHEYGHYVVDRHFLDQGSFGEGYSDCIGDLMYNDPMTGRDFLAEGEILRNPIDANQQYPCSAPIHTCGMVLSGIWWDIHLNLWNGSIGDELASLAYVQQAFTDWTEDTIGGDGNDAMHPATATEVLAVTDDDDDPETAGPYDAEVCAAFAKHGIICPGVVVLNFNYPNGLPAEVPCDVESTICVEISAGDLGNPEPGSGELFYRILGTPGSATQTTMTEVAPNQYEGTLPALAAGTVVEFYLIGQTETGVQGTDPADAPTTRYSATYSCDAPATPGCDDAPPAECEGDSNGDGTVDPLDSGFALSRFGCSVGTGDADCDASDQNGDGMVDPLDVGYILSRFGDCP